MFGVSYRWVKIYSSVILISLISKVTGFFRDALITARFGATMVTDAYVVALLIPEVLFNVFGNSLTANFAPIYFESESRTKQRKFVSSLFSLYLILAGIIFLIGYKNASSFITLFSSGFKGEAFNTTTFLLKIFMANIFFITITYFCLAYLQAHNQFLIPSTIGVFFNLAIIISMCWKGGNNALHILIIGTLAGYITQFAVQMPQAISRGLPMPTLKPVLSPEIRRYMYLSIPIAFLAILGQLNIAMDNFFASRLSAGSITTLNLGYRVLMGIYSLFITNTMMIVYPELSKSIVRGDNKRASEILQKTVNLLIIVLIPLAIYLFANARQIFELMFRRGAFTEQQSYLTGMVFQGYIIGLLFFAFRDLMLRYFFANHDAMIPMINGFVNSSINFVYLLILVPAMGLPGVSLATALSAISSCIFLFIWARKKTPLFGKLKIFGLVIKIVASSLVSISIAELLVPVFVTIISNNGITSKLFNLGLELIIFGIVYCMIFITTFKRKIFGFFLR